MLVVGFVGFVLPSSERSNNSKNSPTDVLFIGSLAAIGNLGHR